MLGRGNVMWHTYSKTHSVSDDDDSCHTIRTHLFVAINEIVNTEGDSTSIRE